MTDKKLEPSLDLLSAEKLIARHAHPDRRDDVIDAMVAVGKDIATASKKIEDTARIIMGDEMTTPIKRRAKASEAVGKIAFATLPKIDATNARVGKALETLEADLIPPKPKDAEHAVEIRRALRELDPKKRASVVEKAIRAGDQELASAALIGHPVCTGLGEAERAAMLDLWRRTHRGEVADRVQRIRAAQARLAALAGAFQSYSVGMFADDAAAIEAARKSSELAAQAIRDAAA